MSTQVEYWCTITCIPDRIFPESRKLIVAVAAVPRFLFQTGETVSILRFPEAASGTSSQSATWLRDWPTRSRSEAELRFEVGGRELPASLRRVSTSVDLAQTMWLKLFDQFGAGLLVVGFPPKDKQDRPKRVSSFTGRLSAYFDEILSKHLSLTTEAAATALHNPSKDASFAQFIAAESIVPKNLWENLSVSASVYSPLADRRVMQAKANKTLGKFAGKLGLTAGAWADLNDDKDVLDDEAVGADARCRAYTHFHCNQYAEVDQDACKEANAYDFHARWNGLFSHPTMARVFGVVRDYEITLPAEFDLSLFDAGVRIRCLPSIACDSKYPATESVRVKRRPSSAGRFDRVVPMKRDGESAQGLRPLGKGFKLTASNSYDLANRMRIAGERNQNVEQAQTQEAEVDSGLPNGVTWGMALQQVPSPVALSGTKSSQGDTLYAEDLCVGYRFDVRDTSGRSASLCSRIATYSHEGRVLSAYDENSDFEEGVIQQAAKRVEGQGNSNGLKQSIILDELFVWNDRPLCVTPSADEVAHNEYVPTPVTCGSGPKSLPYICGVTPAARSQLPLRFQCSYAVACREVYLGGTGLASGETAHAEETAVYVRGNFDRCEPLAPPSLHLAAPLDEYRRPGDQIDIVVVRSGPSVEGGGANSARYILPPRVTASFANLHASGFDSVESTDDTPAGAFAKCLLADDGSVPSARWIDTFYPGKFFPRLPPIKESGADGKCRSSVHDNSILIPKAGDRRDREHEFYPDPCVNAINFSLSPRSASCWGDSIGKFDLYAAKRTWPNAGLLRLEVAAVLTRTAQCSTEWKRIGGGGCSRRSGVLKLDLLPGEDLVLKLWSSVQALDAQSVARANAGRDQPSVYAKLATVYRSSELRRGSGHELEDLSLPFANPAMDVRVIHATQLPWYTPEFITGRRVGHPANARCQRTNTGATLATFEGNLRLHRATTISVQCTGKWTDIVDDPDGTANGPRDKHHHAPGFTLPAIGVDDSQPDQVALEVDDRGEERVLGQEFGDTRHHRVEYRLRATSRFAEWFPATLRKDHCSRTSESPWITDVLSSKRPEPPKLFYLVPLLQTKETTTRTSTRVATRMVGFRAWLDAPLFGSGNFPHLAVICWPGDLVGDDEQGWLKARLLAAHGDAEALKETGIEPFLSRCGDDPLWPGSRTTEWLPSGFFEAPTFEANLAFPGAVTPEGGEAITSDERVSIAAYPIDKSMFDHERGQYAVDIRVNTDALARRPKDRPYLPFVRLALAVYQPYSLPGVELSPVVVADLAQVSPTRHATCTPHPKLRNVRRIVVSGYGEAEYRANRPKDSSERRRLHVFALVDAFVERETCSASQEHELMLEQRSQDFVAVYDIDLAAFEHRPRSLRIVIREKWSVLEDTTRPGDSPPDKVALLPRIAIVLTVDL